MPGRFVEHYRSTARRAAAALKVPGRSTRAVAGSVERISGGWISAAAQRCRITEASRTARDCARAWSTPPFEKLLSGPVLPSPAVRSGLVKHTLKLLPRRPRCEPAAILRAGRCDLLRGEGWQGRWAHAPGQRAQRMAAVLVRGDQAWPSINTPLGHSETDVAGRPGTSGRHILAQTGVATAWACGS